MGSTFSQIPVPGERKSGIPDGTEIPAPVSATVVSASPSRRASSVAWVEICGVAGGTTTKSYPLTAAAAPSAFSAGPASEPARPRTP
jgi:hypothetical protein